MRSRVFGRRAEPGRVAGVLDLEDRLAGGDERLQQLAFVVLEALFVEGPVEVRLELGDLGDRVFQPTERPQCPRLDGTRQPGDFCASPLYAPQREGSHSRGSIWKGQATQDGAILRSVSRAASWLCMPAGMLGCMPGSSDRSDLYAAFAPFYDWLANDEVISGESLWNRFGDSLSVLQSGAHILDCACGTGYNALALIDRGFTVSGSDASQAMLTEARRRLPEHVNLRHCAWSELPGAFAEPFDAVVCTGNSLMHAGDERRMVAALTGISGVLKPGGLLVLDSRNYEKLRGERPLLQPRSPISRSGKAAVAIYTWHWPDDWDADHRVEITVVSTDGHETKLGRTNFTYRPFSFEDLTERLSRVGFEILSHTFSTETYVYEVTARLSSSMTATRTDD